MARGGKPARSASAPTAAATAAGHIRAPLKVPLWFRLLRWTCFCATVGIAIGMLALMNQQLDSIGWVYDGALPQYLGRAIRIEFCMFSKNTDFSAAVRCNFGFAVAAVSLVLSFIWSYLQAMRRNPFKHPSARLVDLGLCGTWLLFWGAAAVVLCVWTDQANKAGSFLSSAKDARNGFCVMAWLEFLLVGVLTATAGLLFSPKCQNVFDKWDAKSKQKKYDQEQRRLQGQQAQAAEMEAAAAAAKHSSTAAAAAPASAGAGQPAAFNVQQQQQHVEGSRAAALGTPGRTGTEGPVAAGVNGGAGVKSTTAPTGVGQV